MTEPGKWAGVAVVIAAFVMIAFAVEWARMRMNGWLALATVSIIVLVMALLIHGARARDLDGRYAGSPLKEWFDGLKSGKGPCCSDADGYVVKDADWKAENGHYRVFVEGEWRDVPDDAVITEPNLYGRTMVWPIKGWGGLTIRCFMPGSMT